MRRREFITGLGGTVAAWPMVAQVSALSVGAQFCRPYHFSNLAFWSAALYVPSMYAFNPLASDASLLL
jgi:hypothetical protein